MVQLFKGSDPWIRPIYLNVCKIVSSASRKADYLMQAVGAMRRHGCAADIFCPREIRLEVFENWFRGLLCGPVKFEIANG
jgi:hypothetical protein